MFLSIDYENRQVVVNMSQEEAFALAKNPGLPGAFRRELSAMAEFLYPKLVEVRQFRPEDWEGNL